MPRVLLRGISRAATLGSVSAADAVVGLVAVWLMLGVLTAAGARHRGRRWGHAVAGGLLFPVTWVVWYLIDRRLSP